ncbi:MAG: hypothetical protein LAP61_20495 [Acidobacteriia bacterium]|nr:hypothetical protein [Terriglobia bacterium]
MLNPQLPLFTLLNVMKVEFEPAPRSVTLLLPPKSIVPEMAYVPAGTRTTVLLGAEVIALLMLAAVTVPPKSVLHWLVTQLVCRLGIPPDTPAPDQSTARFGLRIPDQFWAFAEVLRSSKRPATRTVGIALALAKLLTSNRKGVLSNIGFATSGSV